MPEETPRAPEAGTVSFHPADIGLMIPNGAVVLLVSDDGRTPPTLMIPDEDGTFTAGGVPPGTYHYEIDLQKKVVVQGEDKKLEAGAGADLNDTRQKTGERVAQVVESVDEGEGEKTPKASEAPETPEAPATPEAPKAPAGSDKFREGISLRVRDIFNRSERADKSRANDLHVQIADFARVLRERAESGESNNTADGLLSKDLLKRIADVHGEWIDASDMDDSLKVSLKTPAGRMLFRSKAFNQLCDKGQLGLSKADKVGPQRDESKMREHMKSKLGRNWTLFDRQCSETDGGAILHTLKQVSEKIVSDANGPERVDRESRAFERAQLAKKIERDIRSGARDTYKDVPKAGIISKIFGEGGDLYLKIAGISMMFSNPLLGAGLISARAFTQASGMEFGQALKGLLKLPIRVLRKGSKATLRALPDNIQEKYPDFMRDWINSPSTGLSEGLKRISLTWGERRALFLRGLAPVPIVSVPMAKFTGRGIRAIYRGIRNSRRVKQGKAPIDYKTDKPKAPKQSVKSLGAIDGAQRNEAREHVSSACDVAMREVIRQTKRPKPKKDPVEKPADAKKAA